jgi:dTDP-4-amino-4,6-dideoxygalactose transaminase
VKSSRPRYSFVATAHSLLWNNIRPVFVDINRATMNLDPAKIEAVITPQTTATCRCIATGIPVTPRPSRRSPTTTISGHLRRRSCVRGAGCACSILRHGNPCSLSYHAPKDFNAFEGGAIICPDVRTRCASIS